MSRPRRLAWSFLWVRKCSVSPVMRSVKSAICTSGEPVSFGSRRYESMISVLRSLVIAIAVLITSAADAFLPRIQFRLLPAVLQRPAEVGERWLELSPKREPARPVMSTARLNSPLLVSFGVSHLDDRPWRPRD